MIKDYAIVTDDQALLIMLWAVFTWCYQEFDRCPLLLINAPERASGKTQLLKIVGELVSRPHEIANITVAGMFRTIDEHGRTLLIDEGDCFLEGKSELAGLLNSGYQPGVEILRTEAVGKEFVNRAYQVYGPKAIAGIALERHLPSATMSRGIQIVMRRKMRTEVVKRLRFLDRKDVDSMRSRIYRFVQDHRQDFALEIDLPERLALSEHLEDRAQDNAEPLLTIAKCFGEQWYDKAKEAFFQLAAGTAPPKSLSNQLLEDVRIVFRDLDPGERWISTAKLLGLLCSDPEMDWKRHGHGQGMTAKQMAGLLRGYGIVPQPTSGRGRGGGTLRGYWLDDFREAFARYLPDEPTAPEDGDVEPGPDEPPSVPDSF